MPWLDDKGRPLNENQLRRQAELEARKREVEEAARILAAQQAGLLDRNGDPIGQPEPEPILPDPEDEVVRERWNARIGRNGQKGTLSPAVPSPGETLEIIRRILADRPPLSDQASLSEYLHVLDDVLANPEHYRIEE